MSDLAGVRAAVSGVVADDRPLDFEACLADGATLAFRIAYSVLRQREDAEDVAQEALARAYRKRGSLRDPARFRAWLARMTWRLALDHRRAGKRREQREQTAVAMAAQPNAEDVAAQNEFRTRLFAAIDALPGKVRIVVVLAGIEGHNMREVASLLGVPEGTVKSRLHDARQRLLEVLR
jgi:RNA polymerase sigma-70 factor (ECF subfamily)